MESCDIHIISCIYKITSPTGKIYIGKTKNFSKRVKDYHRQPCKTQRRLYNSFIKHGIESHVFKVVEYCQEEELNDKEKYYIRLFNTFQTKNGLNLSDGGQGGKMSDEGKKNLSEKRKGKPNPYALKKQSPEHIRKRTSVLKGRKASEEARKKMSLAQKGKKSKFIGIPRSQEVKDKIRMKLIGKKMSDESKIKMSLAGRGRKKSDEHKIKNSESKILFYKKVSPEKLKEMGKKVSEGLNRYWENIRQERATMIF